MKMTQWNYVFKRTVTVLREQNWNLCGDDDLRIEMLKTVCVPLCARYAYLYMNGRNTVIYWNESPEKKSFNVNVEVEKLKWSCAQARYQNAAETICGMCSTRFLTINWKYLVCYGMCLRPILCQQKRRISQKKWIGRHAPNSLNTSNDIIAAWSPIDHQLDSIQLEFAGTNTRLWICKMLWKIV